MINTITIHALQADEIEINPHCFDYLIGYTADDLARGLMLATQGFTTPTNNKLPTVWATINGVTLGLVVSTQRDITGFYTEIITVLPEIEASRNADGKSSLKSYPAEVVFC